MRLRSIPRADRLFGRLPHVTIYSAAELLLLVLIAVQAARLVWILATPVGPVGDYRGTASPAFPIPALGEFDPFFRLSGGGGPATVTSLDLKLYGVREDRATGRGSAIIALPDGTQSSFAVGEEIMAGVTLAEVGFDSVTISRGGTPEQIFLDQSGPAAPAQEGEAEPSLQAPVPSGPDSRVAAPAGPVLRFQPRMKEGRVDGILVGPGSDGGQAFRAAGFAPGDVIVAVDGQPVGSVEQARALAQRSGGEATVTVERGGRTLPMVVRLDR